jgi:hypothetical protein
MATNAKILSAVLNRWAQPLVGTFIGSHVQSIPFVQGLQNKIRSMGWVSPNWSIMAELSPLMESVTGNIIAPMIERYLVCIDDSSIPKMAHSIVDDALKNGELILFEGKITFEEADLKNLKRLLELNLPYNPNDDIVIKTE